MSISLQMTSRMDLQFREIGIDRVQGFVESESHNPVGVVRAVSRLLKIGEREVCPALLVLMCLRFRHEEKNSSNSAAGTERQT